MDANTLVLSKRYKEMDARVRGLRARIDKAGSSDLIRLIREKEELFSHLRDEGELYSVFQIDEKLMSEMIHLKLTGKEITI